MSAIGIDKRENRPAKLFGKMHDPQRLAIPFRMRHAEVAIHALLGIACLLLADDDNFVAVEARHARNDRWVVGKSAIAVNLAPVGENAFDVIERVGALRMPRQLSLLPRAIAGMDLTTQGIDTFMQLFDLAASLLALPRNSLQVLDLLFDPGKFLFGFQSDFHLTGVPIPGVPMRLHHGKQKFCS